MTIRWTSGGRADLRDLLLYVARENPAAARRLRVALETSIARLGDHPYLGRPGAIEGTRELIAHPSYRVVYEIRQEAVLILALVHTARRWPPPDET